MPTMNVPGYPAFQYEELAENSPTYTLGRGNSRVERTFLVPWEHRSTFAKGMLGFCKIRNVEGKAPPYDSYIFRHPPMAILDMLDPADDIPAVYIPELDWYREPQGKWLYATSVSRMQGLTPTGQYDPLTEVPEYEHALVSVVFESLTYKVQDDTDCRQVGGNLLLGYPYEWEMSRYVTRVMKPTAEFLALPRGQRRWVDGTANPPLVDFATAFLVPSVEIVYTWHEVPFIPEATRRCLGMVNHGTFSDGEHSYPPGTLLLVGCDIKPYRTGAGKFVHDVTYRLKYFSPLSPASSQADMVFGHNHFLRYDPSRAEGDRLRFLKITDSGKEDRVGEPLATPPRPPSTGAPLYEYVDFRLLFTFHLPV